MSEGIEGVSEALRRATDLEDEPNDFVEEDLEDEIGGVLPPRFPVQPLGQADGKFHFLTARGEKAELSASAMAARANLVALMAGAPDPISALAEIGPKKSKDVGFNAPEAADRLMEACAELPLFDPSTSMRHFGTWRGETSHPVVHLGETLIAGPKEKRRGRRVGDALYPAVPAKASPAESAATVEDLEFVRNRLQQSWNWSGARDADVIMGWVGQAVLGHFPSWRTHCYIRGKYGSGKSTLTKIVSDLLGGMSTGVKNGATAASIRQITNRQAIARIFDEAEGDDHGAISDVVALFRLMSGSDGAKVERGTSDHGGVSFELYGAGFLAAIIPAPMTPADRSRFVILSMNEREASADPAGAAQMLANLQADAKHYGPQIWRRMISLAPGRWDRTFQVYNGLVQSLGAPSRTGDTVGAILAGWDLMLHDDPLCNPTSGEACPDRLEQARQIAMPFVEASHEADEEGDGERCLRTIFAGLIEKDHGGRITVAELLQRAQGAEDKPNSDVQRMLGRIGLRVVPGERYRRALFVANAENPLLNRILAGSGWTKGGHRAALDTISDVSVSPNSMRVAGRPVRGLIVPAHHLPGYKPADVSEDEMIEV